MRPMASARAGPPTPHSRSHCSKTSGGVRTQMAELMTVEPPTSEPWTMGQKARPRVKLEPHTSSMSRIVPYTDCG